MITMDVEFFSYLLHMPPINLWNVGLLYNSVGQIYE